VISQARTARASAEAIESAVAATVDGIVDATGVDSLIALMAERNPVYQGRGAATVIRMRGYAMAAFERIGLPDRAFVFVLEELESGRSPYLIAAAARALRGLDRPERRLVPFLLRAIDNVVERDEVITFAEYRPTWPARVETTTALAEIFRTLAWLGPHAASAIVRLSQLESFVSGSPEVTRSAFAAALAAVQAEAVFVEESCCTTPAAAGPLPDHEALPRVRRPPLRVRFEDQAGRRLTFSTALTGAPTIVTFFYTRCMNPNKCSLTITKVGRLHRAIADAGRSGAIRIAAVSYDPGYDLPSRLVAYGQNRGIVFDENIRLLRTTSGFASLATYFELGVSYGPATVNQHRIEAFVLDSAGSIQSSFTRLQWDGTDVLATAVDVVERDAALR